MKTVLLLSVLFFAACNAGQSHPGLKPLEDVHFSIENKIFLEKPGKAKGPPALKRTKEGQGAKTAPPPQDCISNNIEHKGEFIREVFCEPKPCYMSFRIESNQRNFVPMMQSLASGFEKGIKQTFSNARYSESGGCKRVSGENEEGDAKMIFCEPAPGRIIFRMDTGHKQAVRWIWETRSATADLLKAGLSREAPFGFPAFPENSKRLFESCKARPKKEI